MRVLLTNFCRRISNIQAGTKRFLAMKQAHEAMLASKLEQALAAFRNFVTAYNKKFNKQANAGSLQKYLLSLTGINAEQFKRKVV